MDKKLIVALFNYNLDKVNIKGAVEAAKQMPEPDKTKMFNDVLNRFLKVRWSHLFIEVADFLGRSFTQDDFSRMLDGYLRDDQLCFAMEVAKELSGVQKRKGLNQVLKKLIASLKPPYSNFLFQETIKVILLPDADDKAKNLEKVLSRCVKFMPFATVITVAGLLKKKLTTDELVEILGNHLKSEWVDEDVIAIAKEMTNPSKTISLNKILDRCLNNGQFDIAAEAATQLGRKLTSSELNKILTCMLRQGRFEEGTVMIAGQLPDPHKNIALKKILNKSLDESYPDLALISAKQLSGKDKITGLKKIILWCLEGDRWIEKAEQAAELLPEKEREMILKLL